jgi:hypothetical protein
MVFDQTMLPIQRYSVETKAHFRIQIPMSDNDFVANQTCSQLAHPDKATDNFFHLQGGLTTG